PLRVRQPLSLVSFSFHSKKASSNQVPYPAVVFYARHSRSLSAVMAQTSTSITLTGEPNREIRAGLVTANYFSELGATPFYGRLFDPNIDGAPTAAPVAVLGHAFWLRHFGGDPAIVNRTVRLNQHTATVIGVLPPDFLGLDLEKGETNDVWLVLPGFAEFVPGTKLLSSYEINESGVHMSARLKPGVTRAAAAAELQPLSDELARQNPSESLEGFTLLLYPGGYAVRVDPGDPVYAMFALFGSLVLLILAASCGNLGNLLLGHALTRERE